MLRRIALCLLMLTSPALAGPREDAEAVFGRFLENFTAANADGILGLFWPDALVWGTTMRDLATTPEAVAAYFAPMRNQQPNARSATALGPVSAAVVSDSVVLLSGMWQVESTVNGAPRVSPLRVSIAVTRRGAEWRMAQFHNSPRPVQ